MAGDDSLLVKIAVFGITMSIISTCLLTVLITSNGDYAYDEIAEYRDDLVSFSGESMINSTPWVLTHVYTPWASEQGIEGHIDADGWLYGSDITTYDDIGESADIHLDANQKSSVLLTTGDPKEYQYVTGKEWWAGGNDFGFVLWNPDLTFGMSDGNTYATGTANSWNYTGYRYTFDPTLPFSTGTSTRDGTLSLVWYSFSGSEGLSGGLDVYGDRVRLASYAATDIIGAYNSSSGYASAYDFDFDGTHLTLLVKFDQDYINAGGTLMDAWTTGHWSMAISTVSAGNFYDIENSNSFVNTAGSLIDTFIQIYTFSMPSIDNYWMDIIMWLLVGLPMTIAMLCVTLRLISSIKVI